jgi:hypothetical protein
MALTRTEAIQYLSLDPKVFDNFFRVAGEFEPLPREGDRGFFYFDKGKLDEWKKNYDSRTFTLEREDYAKCIDFALAMHFRGYVLSDWGTGRQREFGQKMSNWVRGQLGEIGVQYFCQNMLGLDIKLDFDMHEEIVPQDVLSIAQNGETREPKKKIAVKSSKPKSAYLVLSPNEVELDNRKSDVYIFSRVDLPDDHLLRIGVNEIRELVRNQQHYELYEKMIPAFEPISVEVAGFAYIDDLETVEEIPGQKFDGERYVKKSGELRRDIEGWKKVFE